MLIIACISGWLIAVVAIACALWLVSEYGKLGVDLDEAKLKERLAKSAMMKWRDKAQRLERDIYGLSENRCKQCGLFLPHNHAGKLCEVCAWAKSGDL